MGTFTVKEFNQLCAEFMGYKVITENPHKGAITTDKGCTNPSFLHDRMEFDNWHVYPRFNSKWDWIMIVIEKIEKTYDDFHGYFSVQMVGNTCSIVGTKLRTSKENCHPAYYHSLTMDTKLESTVHVIYEFLLWRSIALKQITNGN